MPPSPPDTPVGRGSGPVRALETLLVDLGSQIRPASHIATASPVATPPAPALSKNTGDKTDDTTDDTDTDTTGTHGPHQAQPNDFLSTGHFSTGITVLDAALGGGFPAGRLCEICGVPSSGRTSLTLSLISETLAQNVFAGWVDLADALDPGSAAEAIAARSGTAKNLERLLWVRARSAQEAVRSCERLLQTEGFELVVFDALVLPKQDLSPLHDVTWLRLARLAASTRTTLVVISNAPLTGSRSEFVLEMQAPRARFIGPPNLLQSIETTALLLRHRSRPSGLEIPLSISMEIADGEGR